MKIAAAIFCMLFIGPLMMTLCAWLAKHDG